MLEFDVLTLFPEMVTAPLSQSIMGRAAVNGLISVRVHNIRDWAHDKHHRTDDYLCGGGQGMLMMCEPIFAAIEQLRREHTKVLFMTPQGSVLTQRLVRELAAPCMTDAAAAVHYIILCGHYEGVDQRVVDSLVDKEISIGDYILTNGAIAAVVLIDAISRLVPGALGDERSSEDESFAEGLLEAPAYTKPSDFRGAKVPEVLLSGNHRAIAEWKREQALARTRANRPDLYEAWVKRKKDKTLSGRPANGKYEVRSTMYEVAEPGKRGSGRNEGRGGK